MSWPGIEWLYSGVAIRTASASRIASRSSSTTAGVALQLRRPRRRAGSRRRRSNSTSSAPAGSRSAAARSRALLQRVAAQAAGDAEHPHRYSASSTSSSSTAIVDLVVEHLAAAGQLGVPVEPEARGGRPLAASERPTRALPARSAPSWPKRAARLDLALLAADLELAADGHRAVLADLELARLEAQLRVALGVEEVGGEQVALQLLLVDLDAGDVDRALELRRLAAAEPRLVGAEAAAEGRDAVVGDGEADRGVDRVDHVGACRDLLVDRLGAHRLSSLKS